MFDLLSKIIVSILLFLLIFSFAIWGVADVFSGKSGDVVATVGDGTVSGTEFRKAIFYEKKRLERLYKRSIDPELMKMLGVDARVMNMLVNRKLIDMEADRLGIKVGRKYVLDTIMSNDAFFAENGVFNKEFFSVFLRRTGKTEASFIKEVKSGLSADILSDALTAESIVSAKQLAMIHDYDAEQRKAGFLEIPKNYIEKISDPDNTELFSYYERKKEEFSTSETRGITYISLGIDDVRDEVDTSEETLRKEYKNRIDEFAVNEKRGLRQITLKKEKDSREAYAMLQDKKDFFSVAKEKAGQTKKDTSLGLMEADNLKRIFTDDVVKKIFSLKKGDVTEPVKSSLGWHIFWVTDIIPSKISSFDDIKDSFAKTIEDEQAEEILYNLASNLEDELASGSTLEETAKKFDLEVHKITAVDANGKSDGNISIPPYKDFLKTAFTIGENENSGIISERDGLSYYTLRVDGIISPRIRTLDEVRGAVITAWKESVKREKLKKFADDTAEEVSKNQNRITALESIAGANELTYINSEPFYRYDNILPVDAIAELFSADIGESTKAYIKQDGSYIIAVLTDVIKAEDKGKYNIASIRKDLENSFKNDLLLQYLAYLRTKYPVEYNESVIKE